MCCQKLYVVKMSNFKVTERANSKNIRKKSLTLNGGTNIQQNY